MACLPVIVYRQSRDCWCVMPTHPTCPVNIGSPYVDDDGHYGEYFDSLGRPPNRLFEHYMNAHCREWTYNCKQLQSITSTFCGHYCVCFCILRSSGIDMRRFVRCFTRDTGLNDVIVHELICSLMNVK